MECYDYRASLEAGAALSTSKSLVLFRTHVSMTIRSFFKISLICCYGLCVIHVVCASFDRIASPRPWHCAIVRRIASSPPSLHRITSSCHHRVAPSPSHRIAPSCSSHRSIALLNSTHTTAMVPLSHRSNWNQQCVVTGTNNV